jgi:hypothetical protein
MGTFHLCEPSWIEDPAPAIRTLQHDIGRSDRDPEAELAAMAVERERLVAEARERLRSEPQPGVNQFETCSGRPGGGRGERGPQLLIDFRAAYQFARYS